MSVAIGMLLVVAGANWATTVAAQTNAAQTGCAFSLGFEALHDAIPAIVGDCTAGELYDAATRESHQSSTRGRLTWREADNLTFFTDSERTWTLVADEVQSWANQQPTDPAATPATPIGVFFSHDPESADDFTRVFRVDRTAHGPRVATSALESLIAGPTDAERADGYSGALGDMLHGTSACGAADFVLTIDQGLAEVRFCRPLASPGVGQDARARSQVDATLRQFPSVQRVRLLSTSGHCLFDESGLDLCLAR